VKRIFAGVERRQKRLVEVVRETLARRA